MTSGPPRAGRVREPLGAVRIESIIMADQGIPIIGPILNKIIGTRNDRFVKKYNQRVREITNIEPQMRRLTDPELRGKIAEFRARHDKGAKADDMMIDAFAVAREAMDRGVGLRSAFNPQHGFDPSRLKPEMRDLYAGVKAQMDATAPIVPRTFKPTASQAAPPPNAVPDTNNEFLGCMGLVEGWMQVDIPPELYEAIRELYPESRPPFRARPFDVQLIGGMVLTQGKIAEMRTGEGKTIVGPLATYLATCERLRVHVVTVNDYLVQRDRDWTFPFFRALGLTVGAIHPQHMQDEDEKRFMYRCDVTYGTTAEFGFDYLRDNMKRSVEQQVQKRRQFAIVDEVDSILIDEARTPLIISGQAHQDRPRYELADQLARHLVSKNAPWAEQDEKVQECKKRIKGIEGDIRQARDKAQVPELTKQLNAAKAELPRLEAGRDKFTQYYETQLERKSLHVTHDGVAEAQRVAQVGSFYVDQNMDLPHLMEQSLRAHVVYQRDRDYVIMNTPDQYTGRQSPTVVIVDVFTGRAMIGRQWSDGLHQAVEAKEAVPIKDETQTVATVTIQNFFKMYKRLAGMTGTADTEAQEFHDIYHLDVVSIPTNKPVVRRDFDDMVFLVNKDKWNSITDEIKAFNDVGRPILVGTTSVEKSEFLSKMLMSRHGVQHEVLNAKQHEREAHIVENAGQLGQVMIATNMAGRGTDIKLGKITRQALLDHWLKRGLAPRTLTVDATDEQVREAVYRKVGSQYLKKQKREIEEMPFAELEIELLREWASRSTWADMKAIERMNAEQLRQELDSTGRFLLHRLRWFGTIEDMGGLHVIGTERHEARRIDNQLRGRGGRQGDKGSSRFFVALDDDLMKMFAGETTMKVLARLGMKEGDAIEHPMLSKSVERAQRKVEERNFQIRKNVLEYDEVMEHQRQYFYGLRQRVLEGRDVKGLMFEFVGDAVTDACDTYLDPDYPATCAAEFAKSKLECSIDPLRLKGKDRDEMEKTIREDAKADARHMVDVTLGEFMPMEGSDISVDFDSAGLINWARSRFNVEINTADLREGGAKERNHVRDMLVASAEAKIEEADLSGIDELVDKKYGILQLIGWVKNKLLLDVTEQEIAAAQNSENQSVSGLILEKATQLYTQREAEYPVGFAMDTTKMLMRQSPKDAAEYLVKWANQRFALGWTMDQMKTSPPQKIQQILSDEAQKFVAEGKLEKAIADAIACKTDDALDAHLQARYGVGITEYMRFLEGEERENAIRARIENILRAELLHFERTVLLETLDQSWKDHLYGMEKLRDSIGFRAFSQEDPKIAFKREGSRLFKSMLDSVRDQVTDYVFKAKLSPQLPPQARPAQPSAAAMLGGGGRAARPASISGPFAGGGMISGPGLGSISGPGLDPAPGINPPPGPSAQGSPEEENPDDDQSRA
ncbi:MAG: preprotein translocase subunit SecA [Phycisphaerales bacterium]|nr:preprotein translocase subunit SecA [Phycisphaerales bacterium]